MEGLLENIGHQNYEKGMAVGKTEGSDQMYSQMLKAFKLVKNTGMSAEEISKSTGLSKDQVEGIIKAQK